MGPKRRDRGQGGDKGEIEAPEGIGRPLAPVLERGDLLPTISFHLARSRRESGDRGAGVAAVLTRAGWRAMPGARPCYALEAPRSVQKRPSLAMQGPGYVTGQRSNLHRDAFAGRLCTLRPAVRLAQQAPRRVPQDLGVLQRRQWIDHAGAA